MTFASSARFGDQALIRDAGASSIVTLAGARVTTVQLAIITASTATAVFAWGILRFTRWRAKVRAVANDPVLARIVGIPVQRIFLFVFCLGSGLAALAPGAFGSGGGLALVGAVRAEGSGMLGGPDIGQ
jgi:branched-chain amino acid transport system permease protein